MINATTVAEVAVAVEKKAEESANFSVRDKVQVRSSFDF